MAQNAKMYANICMQFQICIQLEPLIYKAYSDFACKSEENPIIIIFFCIFIYILIGQFFADLHTFVERVKIM